MSLKQFRNNEMKLQEQFYENVFLLTKIYAPSEDFKVHFKKDMFVKNNKAGFYQVVYYLLNILNPELIKQKLPSWPPYDIRLESKFRTELIQYINELNSVYENANIPILMTSHLISPGGAKFLKFMLKLTQLVMFEHLRKTSTSGDLLLHNLKSFKCAGTTKQYTENLIELTNKIEEETRTMYDNFQDKFADTQKKADQLIEEKTDINLKLASISKQYEKMQEDCKGSYSSPPLLEIKDKINSLKLELEKIKTVENKFENLEILVSFLFSEKNILNIGKDPSDLPPELKHIYSTKDEEFDFIKFLSSVCKFLDQSALHLPHVPPAYFLELRNKIDEMAAKYSEMNKRADRLHDDLLRLAEQKNQWLSSDNGSSLQQLTSVPKIILQVDDMYDLAVPLEDSPEGV